MLHDALRVAWQRIQNVDTSTLTTDSGCEVKDNTVMLRLIDSVYHVDLENCEVRQEKGGQAPEFITVILLHYLLNTKSIPLSGELISFRELYGGDVYYDAFHARTILPLLNRFGPEKDMNIFLEKTKSIGGERVEIGHAAARFFPFPRIPVVIVIWQGDEEVPSAANILFDSTANQHLPTEDLTVLTSLLVSRLVKR